MNFNIKTEYVVGASVIGTLLYIGYSIHKSKETERKFERIMNNVSESLAKDIDCDISQEIVDRAISKAVDTEVRAMVSKSCNEISRSTRRDISDKISKAVDSSYSDIKSQVRSSIKTQLGNIDISEVRKEVISDAKDEVANRLERDLDDILDGYNDKLKYVTKVYGSINKAISGIDLDD